MQSGLDQGVGEEEEPAPAGLVQLTKMAGLALGSGNRWLVRRSAVFLLIPAFPSP